MIGDGSQERDVKTTTMLAAVALVATVATCRRLRNRRSACAARSKGSTARRSHQAGEGRHITVKLDRQGPGVRGGARRTLADVKPGAYIGVGAMPQPDGSQKAIQV